MRHPSLVSCLAALLCSLAAVACGSDDDAPAPDGRADVGARDAADASSGDGSTDGGGGDDAASGDRLCGDEGERCCPGQACSAGGCCVDQVCLANDAACGGDLGTCHDGSCGACGGLGQPCCLEHVSDGCSGATTGTPQCHGCTSPGTRCTVNDPAAQPGIGTCEACGRDGEGCCRAQECLPEYALCRPREASPSMCTEACGHPGEPCCQDHACRDDGCCVFGGDGPEQCVVGPDCGDFVEPTPDGPVACGGTTCAAGQLCLDTAVVHREDTSHSYRCATMPTACAGEASSAAPRRCARAWTTAVAARPPRERC